jgi:hypothetical protein
LVGDFLTIALPLRVRSVNDSTFNDISSEFSSLMDDAGAYEEQHVHSVYEEIATHFSSTRYKVRQFVNDTQYERKADRTSRGL